MADALADADRRRGGAWRVAPSAIETGKAGVLEATANRDSEGVRDPDAELIRGIAEGDARAVRAFVDRHLPRMVHLARRMLGDETESEDVAQEVFVRAWRMAPRWRPGAAKFETWMHRVALNLCYDRLRRRRETLTDTLPEREDEGPSPFDAVHAADVSARVDAAILALPERQRAAITLCCYQELTNIEAADTLGVSVEAVESLLARARRALKTSLADEAPDLIDGASVGIG